MSNPRFFSLLKDKDDTFQCDLCPWRCVLPPGGKGRCRVRFNREGKAALPFYGLVTALALDPIEKKPLYHFRPGTEILSAGFAGCNLRCPFCQNWHISQDVNEGNSGGRKMKAAELVSSSGKSAQIAYTYSEPLVHIEFLLDCMKEARKNEVANVLVSNGCINSEAAEEILSLTDAANIDLKCFSEKTYRDVLGGDLDAVLGFIRMAVEKGVHLEISTLVVPGLNDSEKELGKCQDFIAEFEEGGNIVPWHLSAYRPCYKWEAPATEAGFLISAAKKAREKIAYVYTGNIAERDQNFNDTLCPHCGKTLVSRRGYRTNLSGLSQKKGNGKPVYLCAACEKPVPLR